MVANRTVSLPGIWAEDAQTTIPTPPVANTTYRNTEWGETEANQGWAFQKIVDSADFNQAMWYLFTLQQMQEQFGILPWCSTTAYKQNGICLGSDGIFYWAKSDNTGVNPINDTGMTTWGIFLDPGDNFVTETVLTNQINLCEKLANKVQALSSSSTTTQYPSAKCVYDNITNAKADLQAQITSNDTDITSLKNNKQNNITGGATTITTSNLTTNRALISDGNGKVAVSAVTNTELGYLDGVTSSVQNQINSKQATITGGATTITGSNLTANRALISNGSGKVAVSNITNTELNYLDGVTSNIQTQLNGKQASGSYMTLSGNQTASGNKTFSGQIIRSTAPGASDNSTQVPNTSWVNSRITSIMNTIGQGYTSQKGDDYIKFSNGLIVQWGRVSYTTSAQYTVSFNIPFTNANSISVALMQSASASATVARVAYREGNNLPTVSNFTIGGVGSRCYPFTWIAIGY